jgi:CheB methylesterase
MTFAQDATAEYSGMPESAISTGFVDFVLPTETIAEELIRLVACWPSPSSSEDDSAELLRISSAACEPREGRP